MVERARSRRGLHDFG